MVTAKAEESDELVGFATGADDYVTKPYSVKILIERIKKELRRRQLKDEPAAGSQIESQGIVIDRHSHRAFYRDDELPLTPTEFRLLEVLIRQAGRAFTRFELMDAAIGEDAIVLERTIDVHIKSLTEETRRSWRAYRNRPRRRLSIPRASDGEYLTSARAGSGRRSTIGPEPGRLPFRDQLCANDLHVAGSVDSQPHLPSLEPDDRDADVVTDEQLFHELAGQHQHVCLPLQFAQVRFQPTFRFIGCRVFERREARAHDEPSSN